MNESIYLIINGLTGIILSLLAFKFFLARQYFEYHSQITGVEWKELKSEIKTLVLSLMHAVGVCLFPIAFVFLRTTWKIYNDFDFSIQKILTLTGIILFSGLFYVTFGIYKKTKAITPWKLVLVFLILNVISLIIQLK